MTQEQKELLLKDLCSRLPYGVICDIYNTHCTIKERLVFSGITRFVDDTICVRPYLFPISSMTEEQKRESPFESSLLNAFINGYISLFEDEELTIDDLNGLYDWFNKNHFDYRGLIPLGLANDATNLNIY